MNWWPVIPRFMSLCFLAGVVRAAEKSPDLWNGLGIVGGCLACAVFWTQANRLDGMK